MLELVFSARYNQSNVQLPANLIFLGILLLPDLLSECSVVHLSDNKNNPVNFWKLRFPLKQNESLRGQHIWMLFQHNITTPSGAKRNSLYDIDCKLLGVKLFVYKTRLFVACVVVIKIKCPIAVYFLKFNLNRIFMFKGGISFPPWPHHWLFYVASARKMGSPAHSFVPEHF